MRLLHLKFGVIISYLDQTICGTGVFVYDLRSLFGSARPLIEVQSVDNGGGHRSIE